MVGIDTVEFPKIRLNQHPIQSVDSIDLYDCRASKELRSFAINYVSQVVSKANELAKLQAQLDRNKQLILIRDAASQINQSLQLTKSSLDDQNARPATTKQPKSARLMETPMIINSPFESSEPNSQDEILACNQTDWRPEVRSHQPTASSSSQQNRKHGFSQRLNLQLLLSCFSTCLPHVIVDNLASTSRRHSNDSL